MRKFIIALTLLVSSVSFAQPTSGDIVMVELDSAELLPELIAPQQSFESIITSSFKMGNAEKIAAYFGENVDLSILGKTNLYSKSQAQQVLQHFFTDNKPASFKIIHKGDSKSTQYFICELISTQGIKYRVTLNSKIDGSKKTITSLTIGEN